MGPLQMLQILAESRTMWDKRRELSSAVDRDGDMLHAEAIAKLPHAYRALRTDFHDPDIVAKAILRDPSVNNPRWTSDV